MSSAQAVGSIETKGFPAVLAASDAMVKAGRVTLVGYLRAGSARFTVNIRGDVSEVKVAMEAGIAVVEKVYGGTLSKNIAIVSGAAIRYKKDADREVELERIGITYTLCKNIPEATATTQAAKDNVWKIVSGIIHQPENAIAL
jgi:microcompartment protein CcmL/EutN